MPTMKKVLELTEENFLDLYKFTRKKVTPKEFYNILFPITDKIRQAAFERGVDAGKDLMLKVWNRTIK